MFTGIIEETGKITQITETTSGKSFQIKTKSILKGKKEGQSIAINGACMTITKITKDTFSFDVIPESLKLTNLGELAKGDTVNLESALKLGDSLDGHLVLGHIDTLGTIKSFTKTKGRVVLTIVFPKNLSKYLAFKGSIAINGTSLTISDLQIDHFSVDLIPHTLKNTNLSELREGDKVNLEIDMISRYLERMLQDKEKEAKFDFLKDRNFI